MCKIIACLSVFLCVLLNALQAAPAAIVAYTGGDFGEGYVGAANAGIDATLVYAHNMGAASTEATIQGDLFGTTTPTGVTYAGTAGSDVGPYTAPFGPSTNDLELNKLVSYMATYSDNVTINATVIEGREYMIQLFFGLATIANSNNFNFSVEGSTINSGVDPRANATLGWVLNGNDRNIGSNIFSHTLVATDSTLSITISAESTRSLFGWSLIDITPVPEPATGTMLLVGCFAGILLNRRRHLA